MFRTNDDLDLQSETWSLRPNVPQFAQQDDLRVNQYAVRNGVSARPDS